MIARFRPNGLVTGLLTGGKSRRSGTCLRGLGIANIGTAELPFNYDAQMKMMNGGEQREQLAGAGLQ
jgi:hypothetical protein